MINSCYKKIFQYFVICLLIISRGNVDNGITSELQFQVLCDEKTDSLSSLIICYDKDGNKLDKNAALEFDHTCNCEKISDNQPIMDDKTLFIKTQGAFEKADVERLAQNWEVANNLLKQALDELGRRYARPSIIVLDDSGMYIAKANGLEREGKLAEAVNERRGILESRMEQLRLKVIDNQPILDDKTLFMEIKAQLEKADAETKAQNWKAALEALKQALAELGTRYTDDHRTHDESNRRLFLASIHEKEGKLDEAVNVRLQILAERLEMLKNKL